MIFLFRRYVFLHPDEHLAYLTLEAARIEDRETLREDFQAARDGRDHLV